MTNLEEMIVAVINSVLVVCFEAVVVLPPIPVSSVEQGTVV